MATPRQAPIPSIADELQHMEYEPLTPVENKLIWYTFGTGVVLLVVFLLVTQLVGH
jgi:hypothetical protein